LYELFFGRELGFYFFSFNFGLRMMILKYQYHINSQISDESQLENYSVMLLSFKSILAFILSERVILLGKPFVFHISALPNCCGNYLITADKKKQLRLL
jgi:hypothetical protein